MIHLSFTLPSSQRIVNSLHAGEELFPSLHTFTAYCLSVKLLARSALSAELVLNEISRSMTPIQSTKSVETTPLATSRPRPQYNYFYGSASDGTDALTVTTNDTLEQESLIGEVLVQTDNEDELHNGRTRDMRHLMIANGNSSSKSGVPGVKLASTNGLGRVLLILLLAASVCIFFILMIPHTPHPIVETQSIEIPFEKVNRADYGDPVDGLLNVNLFHPTLISNNEQRTFNFPFPTGAFWTNLVVPSPESLYSYPIVVYPYAYKWSDTTLQLSYPAAHRIEDKNHHWIADPFAPDLTLSTSEAITSRYLTRFDPLSVTLRFIATAESKFETTLVQGSPYTTIKYLNATPTIQALSTFKSVQCPGDEMEDFHDLFDDEDDEDSGRRRLFGVCSLEEGNDKTAMRGVQFMISSQEGAYWILFASEPINLVLDNLKRTTVVSTTPFTGILRIAYIPAEEASDTSTFISTGLRRLIYHAGVYPTGAQVSWDFHSQPTVPAKNKVANTTTPSSRKATLHFSFVTRGMTDDSSYRTNNAATGLLMLALPHHVQVLPKAVQLSDKRFDLTYSCIKGPLTPIVGSDWAMEESLPDLDFDDSPYRDLDPGVRQTILDQVFDDMNRVLPTNDENVYGYGKQVARLAQLAHIASVLENEKESQSNDDDQSSTTSKVKELLMPFLENFLSSQVADYLLYDSNMGGLVSKNGLSDKSADFGNGRYNDHHFHYGYLLYASAIMAKLDPTFVDRFGIHVDAIFHDVAHSTNGESKTVFADNALFPLSRHKSWFDGHSFATGMFPFGDGKSQESSSEAVNCYYGAYLWSLVRHGSGSIGSDLTDFARLLFAMEVRGAKTYWHMIPKSALGNKSLAASPVYSPTFQANYMVGNVGMMDVAVNTWFGNDALYVHMINAIPITAATSVLFDKFYVERELKYLMDSHGDVEMAWRGYTVSISAIVDSNKAWEDAQGLVSYELDSAISKSQVLYWISSRPDFNVTVAVKKKSKSSTSTDASCSVHQQCNAASLSGLCCPTADGIFLGCCGSTDSLDSRSKATLSSSKNDNASCDKHSVCAKNGLIGLCCPTSEGVMLGCCA